MSRPRCDDTGYDSNGTACTCDARPFESEPGTFHLVPVDRQGWAPRLREYFDQLTLEAQRQREAATEAAAAHQPAQDATIDVPASLTERAAELARRAGAAQ